jgi:CheY-like chemotaxis protein
MCTSAQTGKSRRGGFIIGTRGFKREQQVRFQAHFRIYISARLVSETMDATTSDYSPALPRDVLIVEDDPIIALDFEDTILGLGVTQVRTAGNVAKALDMIADRVPDFALLDVGLIREKSFAVAERLEALQIPFAFVTGYGADVRLPAAFAHKPRLPKPCSTDALEAVLKHCSGEGAEP